MDNNEDKIVVKLNKEYLSSERRERKYKNAICFLVVVLFAAILLVVFLSFQLGTSASNVASNSTNGYNKIDNIRSFLNDEWLYGNEYENLDDAINKKIYYGMTSFDDDPYTTYMDPSEMSNFAASINKVQLGIGLSYYKEYQGYPYVKEVFKDSGAYNAGIKKGDRIIEIAGKSVKGADDDTIKGLVLGDENSFVTVTVMRDNEKIEFECERKQFDSTAVAKLYDDVVVLTLSSFGDNTAATIDNELSNYKNYHKLVIDERGNSGGYQDALLQIAGLFLEDGTEVMKEIDKDGNSKSFVASYPSKYYNFDSIVILTNGSTASAAEVFAICMKEQHPNTILAGSKTYGKGVVQSTYALKDGSYIKLTTSYWTSPNGVSLKDGGISPDVELALDDAYYLYNYDFDKTITAQYDSVSNFVCNAQTLLEYLGYDVTRTDGYFDKDFISTLNKFKKEIGLKEDGILDYDTYQIILDKFNISEKDSQLTSAFDLFDK